MPLPTTDDLERMTARERYDAFCKLAQYIPDAPKGSGVQYAVRVGSTTLYSDDTHDLREKFEREIKRRKRKRPTRH